MGARGSRALLLTFLYKFAHHEYVGISAAWDRRTVPIGESTSIIARIGLYQRRNFLGPLGLRAAQRTVPSMYRSFFRDIPEAPLLFDVERMIRDGRALDYSSITAEMLEKSWVPSYCSRTRS